MLFLNFVANMKFSVHIHEFFPFVSCSLNCTKQISILQVSNLITLPFQIVTAVLLAHFVQSSNIIMLNFKAQTTFATKKAVTLIQGTGSSRSYTTKSGSLVKIFCICLLILYICLFDFWSKSWPNKYNFF